MRWMRMRRTVVLLLVLALSVCCAGMLSVSPAEASSAPVVDPYASVAYQHDPAHDGTSYDPGFSSTLEQRWTKQLSGTVGYPVIANGRLFVIMTHPAGYGVSVEALSLDTGDVLWGPTSIGGTYSFGALAYDAGKVFALNHDGSLWAFDAATGAVLWAHQLPNQYSFSSPPTAVSGTVYVGGAGIGGTVYAVDESNGFVSWTAGVENGDDSSPAVDDTGVYVSYACEQSYKFDFSGALVWHHSTSCEGGGGRTPVVHGGRVYIRDDAGMSPAILDAATGVQQSAFDSGTAPALDGDYRVTVGQGTLSVYQDSTGIPLWLTSQGVDVTAPLIVNGDVIEGRADGMIEVRRLEDGSLVSTAMAGAGFTGPDEHNAFVLTGLAEGDGALVAPAGNTLTVFGAAPSPKVSFTGGPAEGGFGSADPIFRFVSTAGGSFECSLDGVTSACASPLHLHHLGVGSHTFTVAVAGTPASGVTRSFVVDAIAPVTRVAAFNPLVTSHREASTYWSATDWGSGVRAFQVRTRVSRGGSPVPAWSVGSVGTATMRSFSVPRHAKRCISLRAVDRVGNWSSWSAAQCVRRR